VEDSKVTKTYQTKVSDQFCSTETQTSQDTHMEPATYHQGAFSGRSTLHYHCLCYLRILGRRQNIWGHFPQRGQAWHDLEPTRTKSSSPRAGALSLTLKTHVNVEMESSGRRHCDHHTPPSPVYNVAERLRQHDLGVAQDLVYLVLFHWNFIWALDPVSLLPSWCMIKNTKYKPGIDGSHM
jgi:hypothetical protein